MNVVLCVIGRGGRVLVEFVKVTQNLACVCLNDSVVSTWTLDS